MNLLKRAWGNISNAIKNSLVKLAIKINPLIYPLLGAGVLLFVGGLFALLDWVAWLFVLNCVALILVLMAVLVHWASKQQAHMSRSMYVDYIKQKGGNTGVHS